MTLTLNSARADVRVTPIVESPVQANVEQVDHAANDTQRIAVDLFDPLLVLYAEAVDDAEKVRVASENRLGALTRVYGLTEASPDVVRLIGVVDALRQLEKESVKMLERRLRAHPLGPWIKAQAGLGDKQVARLLSLIGDPYVNAAKGEPRTVSQLWAYCGLHTLPASSGDPAHGSCDSHGVGERVAARLRKGSLANWSTKAKTRSYLIATSCIKQVDGDYRKVYLARRAHTDLTHPDWTRGHSHNDALRIVSKTVLRDLWREARRLHVAH